MNIRIRGRRKYPFAEDFFCVGRRKFFPAHAKIEVVPYYPIRYTTDINFGTPYI